MESVKRFRFTRNLRIRSGSDFKRVYDLKQRAGDEHLLIFGATNDLEHSRIGLSVSKKHGNAVRRSQIKRRLREAFRLLQHELPKGLDLILIPRQNSGAGVVEYQGSLKALSRKLSNRVARDQPRNRTKGV